MSESVEFGEECALEGVPITVKHRIAPCFGKIKQGVDVFGIVLHNEFVVENQTLDEKIVAFLFVALKITVDEPPLHPFVSHAAGVAGEIHPRRKLLFHKAARTVAFGAVRKNR